MANVSLTLPQSVATSMLTWQYLHELCMHLAERIAAVILFPYETASVYQTSFLFPTNLNVHRGIVMSSSNIE